MPAGRYRIDGTVDIGGGALVVQKGAVLIRTNLTAFAGPLLRLAGCSGSVSGSGTLLTANPSPRGLVNIGPANQSHAGNIEWNSVNQPTK